MGNRAVITTKKGDKQKKLGIYVHWNGGRDSVEAFLRYAKAKGVRPPEEDDYGWARLCQIIANYFGGTQDIGINTVDRLDCNNWDNGVYLIENWEIVGREYFNGVEQEHWKLWDLLQDINEAQPEKERLTIEQLKECL